VHRLAHGIVPAEGSTPYDCNLFIRVCEMHP
jgi:hypothetical protein